MSKLSVLSSTSNRYLDDPVLQSSLSKYLDGGARAWAEPVLSSMGQASATVLNELADLANAHPPVLHVRDKKGLRRDFIEFHPAYTEMKRQSYGQGIIGHYYNPQVREKLGVALEVVKFAQGYLFSQSEQGLYCPICLTDGTAFMIEQFGSQSQKEKYLPRLTSTNVDELWEGSMFLTEKTGGSDVGAIETLANPYTKGRYSLFGEKWFCSNASAELAMVLARPKGAAKGTKGLGLFLLRRHDDRGELNMMSLQRLKDKLA